MSTLDDHLLAELAELEHIALDPQAEDAERVAAAKKMLELISGKPVSK